MNVRQAPMADKFKVSPVRPGFDPFSLRCAAEASLLDSIRKRDAFHQRLLKLAEERGEGALQGNLELIRNAYKLDCALTPRQAARADLRRLPPGPAARRVRPVDMGEERLPHPFEDREAPGDVLDERPGREPSLPGIALRDGS